MLYSIELRGLLVDGKGIFFSNTNKIAGLFFSPGRHPLYVGCTGSAPGQATGFLPPEDFFRKCVKKWEESISCLSGANFPLYYSLLRSRYWFSFSAAVDMMLGSNNYSVCQYHSFAEPVKFRELSVNGCWLAGDEDIKTYDRPFLSAGARLTELVEIKK